MSHCVPAIESCARVETASQGGSLQSGVLPKACDWAKDRANESAPTSERNATRNARTPAIAGVLGMELAGLEPATSWCDSGVPGTRVMSICRAFRNQPAVLAGFRCLPFAGDSRELRPQNCLCGLNPGGGTMRERRRSGRDETREPAGRGGALPTAGVVSRDRGAYRPRDRHKVLPPEVERHPCRGALASLCPARSAPTGRSGVRRRSPRSHCHPRSSCGIER
jgi:hypothetical protein